MGDGLRRDPLPRCRGTLMPHFSPAEVADMGFELDRDDGRKPSTRVRFALRHPAKGPIDPEAGHYSIDVEADFASRAAALDFVRTLIAGVESSVGRVDGNDTETEAEDAT